MLTLLPGAEVFWIFSGSSRDQALAVPPWWIGLTVSSACPSGSRWSPHAARQEAPLCCCQAVAALLVLRRHQRHNRAGHPDLLALLADGVPRSRVAILVALAGRHPREDIKRTVMRLAVLGRLVEKGGRYTLGPVLEANQG
jgi:hypothetical protein